MRTQQILVLGGLVVSIFVAAGWKAYSSDGQGSVSAARAQVTVASYEDQIREIDIATQRFQSVELDVAFLNSPEFRSLKDYSVIIPRPVSVGRINPFEPLSEDIGEERLPTRDQSTLGEDSEETGIGEQSSGFDTSLFDNLIF